MNESPSVMEASPRPQPQRRAYWCFISYRHIDNKEPGREWATWLHQGLEHYPVPKDIVGETYDRDRCQPIPAQIFPVFRDEEELPGGDLGEGILQALEDAKSLVVLCSPRASVSPWMDKEIRTYKRLRDAEIRTGQQPVRAEPMIVVVDGDPEAPEGAPEACIPAALRFEVDETGKLTSEPAAPLLRVDFRLPDKTQGWTSAGAHRLALDHTPGVSKFDVSKTVAEYQKGLEKARLKLIAGILGIPFGKLQMRDETYRRELERKRMRVIAGVLVLMTLLTTAAIIAGTVAVKQRDRALYSYRVSANYRATLAAGFFPDQHFHLARAAGVDGFAKLLDERRNPELLREVSEKLSQLRTYLPVWNSGPGVGSPLTCLDFSPEGRFLVAGFADGSLRKWDLGTAKAEAVVLKATGKGPVNGLAFRPGGPEFAVAGPDGVTLWTEGRMETVLSGVAKVIAWAPDGSALAAGFEDGALRRKDLARPTGNAVELAAPDGTPIDAIAFSPDGYRLAVATWSGELTSRDARTGQDVLVYDKSIPNPITQVAYHPSGSWLIAADEFGMMKFFQSSGPEILIPPFRIETIYSGTGIAFAGGAFMAHAINHPQKGGMALIWNVERVLEGKIDLIATLRLYSAGSNGLAYGPGRDALGTGTQDGRVVLWNVWDTDKLPDFYAYFEDKTYVFDEFQEPRLGTPVSRFINLPGKSLTGMWQAQKDPSEIFDYLLEQGNPAAATSLLDRLPKEHQGQEKVALALLDRAEADAEGSRWSLVELALNRVGSLGGLSPELTLRAKALAARLPKN